ncbi:hypothetical protein QZH41_017805, partial [Actinostola sp. cb2023]
MEVFSLVSAKISPTIFNLSTNEMKEILTPIQDKTNIQFIELCDGFWVSGTYEQIEKTCSMLSTIAATRGACDDARGISHKDMRNGQSQTNGDTDLTCEPVVLDVQPKLMYILHKGVQEIENKYKIKIQSKPDNQSKVTLRQIGSEELFEAGKEEFITLYQKAFQQMDEKRFELDNEDDAKNKVSQYKKDLMEQFDIVIERKDKTICIYGRNDHVEKAMQRLQGKPRRSRKPYKEPDSDVLSKPDTYAQLPRVLNHTLENGVTVSVYQGDITQQRVDVIVNAANERLEHGGGVAGAIVKRGGQQIQHESTRIVQQYGRIPVGNVAYTNPGNLPCKRIFHAIGPQWKVHGPEGSRQLIFQACCNSFSLASQFGAGSIVLPAISSGIFGVPKEVCAEMMFTAAECFGCETTPQNQLRDIRFVNIDSPTNDAFRKEFHERYIKKHPRSSDLENGQQNGKEVMPDNQSIDRKGKVDKGNQSNKAPLTPVVTPSNVANNEEMNDKPISYAAVAAMKRRDDNVAMEVPETSIKGTPPNVPSSEHPSISFQGGFDNRQDRTTRESHGETKPHLVGPEHQRPKTIPHPDMKDTTTNAAKDPRSNINASQEERSNTETQVTPTKEGREDQTVKGESTANVMSGDKRTPQDTDSSSSSRPSGGQTGRTTMEKPWSEPQFKGIGRGRGAHYLAAKFAHPGVAKRDVSTNKQPSVVEEIKYPPEFAPSHPPAELQSPQQVVPPGLEVTQEGLTLAANTQCKGEDGELASTSKATSLNTTLTDKERKQTSHKRKNNDDVSPRSVKLRKEDTQEHKEHQRKNNDDVSPRSTKLRKEDTQEHKEHQRKNNDDVSPRSVKLRKEDTQEHKEHQRKNNDDVSPRSVKLRKEDTQEHKEHQRKNNDDVSPRSTKLRKEDTQEHKEHQRKNNDDVSPRSVKLRKEDTQEHKEHQRKNNDDVSPRSTKLRKEDTQEHKEHQRKNNDDVSPRSTKLRKEDTQEHYKEHQKEEESQQEEQSVSDGNSANEISIQNMKENDKAISTQDGVKAEDTLTSSSVKEKNEKQNTTKSTSEKGSSKETIKKEIEKISGVNKNSDDPQLEVKENNKKDIQAVGDNDEVQGKNHLEKAKIQSSNGSEHKEHQKEGESQQEEQSVSDGNSANEISIQNMKENDKEISTQDGVKAEDTLTSSSVKEKNEKQNTTKSTSEKGSSKETIKKEIEKISGVNKNSDDPQLEVKENNKKDIQAVGDNDEVQGKNHLEKAKIQSSNGSEHKEHQKEGESQQEEQSVSDGNSANEISIQNMKENDKEISTQDGVKAEDTLTSSSVKEKNEKQNTTKSTSEKGSSKETIKKEIEKISGVNKNSDDPQLEVKENNKKDIQAVGDNDEVQGKNHL